MRAERTEHTPPTGVKWHEAANAFPLLEGEARNSLLEDIRQHGVREPIVFLDGAILDGRNRYLCARELGLEYPRRDFGSEPGDGADPVAFVQSLNKERRHQSPSALASAAAKLAKLPRGRPTENTAMAVNTISQDEAAKLFNVSVDSVQRAKVVHERGDDSLIDALDRGEVSVRAAADLAELPKPEQAEIVAKGEKEILEAAKKIRAKKAKVKRDERLDNLAEIAKGNSDLSTEEKFPVIYADPPWRYENPPIGATSRAIENHYPTMTLEEICALPVSDITTDDAILYLWATAPKLAECLVVVDAWGFNYRTHMVWDKEKIGMGYHARNQHELLLICTRGKIPPPEAGTQPASVYREPRGNHSVKPSFFAEMIERNYPELPKVELFCRSPREGWKVWGNQSGET